jgi:hypothetical protein
LSSSMRIRVNLKVSSEVSFNRIGSIAMVLYPFDVLLKRSS